MFLFLSTHPIHMSGIQIRSLFTYLHVAKTHRGLRERAVASTVIAAATHVPILCSYACPD